MRLVEYCWSVLNHSPRESHLSSRWFFCFVIQCSTLFNSCTIGFLRRFCHWSFIVGTHVGRGFPVILWAPDILQKPRGLCLGLVKSSQEETDQNRKNMSQNGEYIYSKHRTQHYVILTPFLLGLLWNGAKLLNWSEQCLSWPGLQRLSV